MKIRLLARTLKRLANTGVLRRSGNVGVLRRSSGASILKRPVGAGFIKRFTVGFAILFSVCALVSCGPSSRQIPGGQGADSDGAHEGISGNLSGEVADEKASQAPDSSGESDGTHDGESSSESSDKNQKVPENAQKRHICLTFDDGPTRVTEDILDVLSRYNIKATFFVTGKNAEKNPEILARIFDEHHTVAIHTYSHVYREIYASPEALADDINRCFCAIKGVNCDFEPRFYRFPGGSFTLGETLKNVPSAMGLRYVDWNAACRDSEVRGATPDELAAFARATAQGKERVIMLLHDAADKKNTALALPKIIEEFLSDGFSFVSLEKVFDFS